MKVILTQNIKGIGKKGEIKEVKDGFARNYLLPSKLAVIANKQNTIKVEQAKRKMEQNLQETIKKIQETKELISKLKMETKLKLDKNGGVVEALNKKNIKDYLSQYKINLPLEAINLKHSLKEKGNHEVEIDLGRGEKAILNIEIDYQK
ncbi:MAG TPA: 50S ribosomal protein L9 [Candidatus Paceibacterota bacterium]|nr:50S ribosomal protein L9 [Candidatus Paceibacterota bacterium]HRS47739.1 50S ribosomal protein L9 [Candidatus Paceibacterota bacterium]